MQADWQINYSRWNEFASLDPALRQHLDTLQSDVTQLEDCFHTSIAFGTGGMRGIMAPGTNRINIYTIRKASAGLARYLLEQNPDAASLKVVIAYDSRQDSHTFALETAKVLGQQGITSCLFSKLTPTPLLSFAVRHLGACAGVVITASHNPPEYNGYKIYGSDGGQIPPHTASRILEKMDEVGDELLVEITNESELLESGSLYMVENEIFDAYLASQEQLRFSSARLDLQTHQPRIVFSPLHGTTHDPILHGLAERGFQQVRVVPEQANPDPEFTYASSPNPENPDAFRLALKFARKKGADLIMCTDPDGDRLGVAVRTGPNQHVILTGNQVGVLLLDYLLLQKKAESTSLPANSVVVKTIVTSEMVRAIAAAYQIDTVDTLTGFKYIGEKIYEYEQTKQYHFLFGLEESCGYLYGDFVRDKDGVQAAYLLADACAHQLSQDRSLYEHLQQLFQKHGYYREDLVSVTYAGKDGMERMATLLSSIRSNPPGTISNRSITAIEDYETGIRLELLSGEASTLSLPKSHVMKFHLEKEAWFCIRPSGTEPKLKLYFGVKEFSDERAQHELATLKQHVFAFLRGHLPS
ncbi:phosphomannomutase [Brevibacillus reuszeri]|uniref:Phosphoglucomutase n=1 Tax=Brevibacillus reuszeri TaxID=54915 RepID=A0A0K9Z034_9BACL|nr:phospho-sugar mutase [Brevibacillus reuszeri]KNB73835.1 phosphoglucomutase [Brevibacillus reuszeri]MED1860018.1 phospho-sugar mutase [Brevibacillus reuszeri]GED71095.1 phosphomannomutase [Brevibacillus reuszeri]